jgi:exodeoxyribonuclease (lambda-induced)
MKQGTAEWFAARKGRVTGSVAGAILGLNPYMTPHDVMRRMVRDYHGAESEFKGNIATEYGSFHEAGAAIEYTMETGNQVTECGFYVHPDYDWLGASPDGLINKSGIIEIKCPYGKRNGGEFKTIEEQPHYYAQIQVELFCAEKDLCSFYQWSAHGTNLERIMRSDLWFDENLPTLKAFYDEYLIEIDNPDHLEPKRKETESIPAMHLLEEYDDLSDAIEVATARKKQVLEDIVALAKGVDSTVCGRKLTQVERVGAVAYAKVVKDHLAKLDLEPYRGKSSSFWKLT